mmetsp:Transcript_13418/g.37764  ORF Transcript_13418/g.37764 Transcript_13418/m.37764 type:complete len:237 (+) Transcript_13418:556-1266(+)
MTLILLGAIGIVVGIATRAALLLSRKWPVVCVGRFPHLIQTRFPSDRKHVLGRPQGNALDTIGPNDVFRNGLLEVCRGVLHSGQWGWPSVVARVFAFAFAVVVVVVVAPTGRCCLLPLVVAFVCRGRGRCLPGRFHHSPRALGFPGRPDLAVGDRLAVGQIQLEGLNVVQVDQLVGQNLLHLVGVGMDPVVAQNDRQRFRAHQKGPCPGLGSGGLAPATLELYGEWVVHRGRWGWR